MKGMTTYAIILIIIGLGIVGEIRCIYQFFTSDFEPSYKREVIYGVGMCTGLGAVIGYTNIPDTPKKP